MAGYNYSFDDDRLYYLRKIGASWFVSYSYYERIDKGHVNWQDVKPHVLHSRFYMFERTRSLHKEWLQEVACMNDARLSTNTIGLSGVKIKAMANELLALG